jgi:hypothetical protein
MRESPINPGDIIEAMLSPSGPPQMFTLKLSECREVYQQIEKRVGNTPVDIVLNGDWAMVQFSRLCNHRIRVIQDPPTGLISRIVRRTGLSERDFEFASLHTQFYGARIHLSFLCFLREEMSTNWLPLVPTMIILWVLFQFVLGTASTGASDALEKVNELVLTATTLYLSIFLLFTISQNIDLVRDPHLFRNGLTHRFFRVDQFLAFLAVVVLCISILNVIILNISYPVSLRVWGWILTLPNLTVVAPFLTAAGVTILVDCFLALIGYYFRRVRYVVERELTKNLLDEIMEERNQQHSEEKELNNEDVVGLEKSL